MNIEQHEEALRQLVNKGFSREETEKEIARLIGEENLAFRLKDQLTQEVNGRISEKAKQKLSIRGYFEKRDIEENRIVGSNFSYAFFEEATLEEIEAINLDLLDPKTLMLIIIQALKGFVDYEQENDPKAVLLHGLYLKLKTELSSTLPFESGDGFLNYLGQREQRGKIENARTTGEICPECASNDIASNGNVWHCRACGHYFRKRR